MEHDWSEEARYRVPLYAFLDQRVYGRKYGWFIYTIYYGDEVVYVGQTTVGVWFRIWQHVSTSTLVGYWIRSHEHDTERVSYCEVTEISGDINMAERYTISALGPYLNKVQYKSSLTLPPLRRADLLKMDLDNLWSVRRAQDYNAGDAGQDLYRMDKLYQRAYRDPNHPGIEVEQWNSATRDVFYYQRTKRLNDHQP